jgi:hypothetical protein
VTVATATLAVRVIDGGEAGAALSAGTEMVVVIAIAGAAAVAVGELERTNTALRNAQAEIERMAVEQERTRFARDLHDLLGQTLSLMRVKLQVADLVLPDVERTRAELGDLERLVRTALEDVREVASSYRQLTLSSEIAGAEIALVRTPLALQAAQTGRDQATVDGWPSATRASTSKQYPALGSRPVTVVVVTAASGRRCAASPAEADCCDPDRLRSAHDRRYSSTASTRRLSAGVRERPSFWKMLRT